MTTDFLLDVGQFISRNGNGYRSGAPSAEAEAIDAEIAEGMRCRRCGGRCTYAGCHQPHASYIALAVCTNPACGFENEF